MQVDIRESKIKALKNAASKSESLPDDCDDAEAIYYTMIRSTLMAYRAKTITADEAKREERAAYNAMYKAKIAAALSKANADLWKSIESAGIRYAKEHTLEAGDAFYEAVYRCGGNWRLLRTDLQTLEVEKC